MKNYKEFKAASKSGAEFKFEIKDNKCFFNAPDGKVFVVKNFDYEEGFIQCEGARIALKDDLDMWIVNAMAGAARKNAILVSHDMVEKIEDDGSYGNIFNCEGRYQNGSIAFRYKYES